MMYDLEMMKVQDTRKKLGRALTLAEKILYSHLYDANSIKCFERGVDYVNFRPDRVAMQDATAQMALLQFMNAGKSVSAVPATVHCDHLIQAYKGASVDLPHRNMESVSGSLEQESYIRLYLKIMLSREE